MAWDVVRKILLGEVINDKMMSKPSLGEKWLTHLEHCEDGKQLGVCMAIDVKSKALDAAIFAVILDELREVDIERDARWAFADAMARHPQKLSFVCATKFEHIPLKDDVYVRVLDFPSFIDYYLGPIYGWKSLNPVHVQMAYHSFFSEEADADWSELQVKWTGSFPRVFVMAHGELSILLTGKVGEQRGAAVNDALGLDKKIAGAPNKPEFVAVLYPQDFAKSCVQPTTLDVPWTYSGWYYVSHKNVDAWGRTQSCSGTLSPVRERVHKEFDNLTSDFSGYWIGESAEIKRDREVLLAEGYRRLLAAIPS